MNTYITSSLFTKVMNTSYHQEWNSLLHTNVPAEVVIQVLQDAGTMRINNGTALLVRHCWTLPWRHHGFQTSVRHYRSTYYDVLGIKKSATKKEIKSAYIELSKKYHPDVNNHPDSEHQFTKVAEAYEVLGNSKSKCSYDNGSFSNTTAGPGGHYQSSTWPHWEIYTDRSDIKEEDLHDVRRGINMNSKRNESESIMAPLVTILDLVSIMVLIAFTIYMYIYRSKNTKNIVFPPSRSEDTDENENEIVSKDREPGQK